FGPVPQRPFFSYFSVDLKSAYSEKIKECVRTFCFLNLGNEQTPAVLIVLDNVTAAKPEFRKVWQVNTLNPPEQTTDGVTLRNSALGLSGKVDVHMLRPAPNERTLEMASGEAANHVFGQPFTPPDPAKPEGHGCRVMFSPKSAQASDTFLAVMPMSDAEAPELRVSVAESPTTFTLTLADRVVVLSKSGRLLDGPFEVHVPQGKQQQLLLAGLAPGDWSLDSPDHKTRFNTRVAAGENTAFFLVPGGDFMVRPEALPGVPAFQAPPDCMPALAPPLANRVFLDGHLLPAPPTRVAGTCLLVPATAVLKTLGLEAAETAGGLRVKAGDRIALFRTGAAEVVLNGHAFKMPASAARDQKEWFLPDSVFAAVAGLDLVRDDAAHSVQFTRSRTGPQSDVLWIEANNNSDPQALRAMLTDIPGRKEYWAAEGRDVRLDLALAQPVKIKGIGIQWHVGATRQAKFALETSADGVTWRKVFEGASSGKSADLEAYSFAPHEVQYVRFHGYGNTQNEWNSIVHFRVIPAEARP
ncbi:MAG: discoidin domain-containing protein, partial [Armatimonadetes bacterium]|nr:discoidin domain-containing protein [Armatimonadota bacterium]